MLNTSEKIPIVAVPFVQFMSRLWTVDTIGEKRWTLGQYIYLLY